jgi:malonyl-CoA/methylmalonyl-CoA synthetase
MIKEVKDERMSSESIIAAFVGHAQRSPERPCLSFAGASLSYGDLYQLALAWAVQLRERGVVRGDRVGLFLGSGPAFVAAYLGTQLLGAAAVLINTQYRQVELSHILSDSGARLVVSEAALLPELARVAQPGLQIVDCRLQIAEHLSTSYDLQSLKLPAAADLALLAYTSGTTGRSKGAMLSHGNLAANSAAVTAAWQWTAADRLLLTLPLFHIHGLGVGLHGSLLAGASIDLRPRFEAAEVLATIQGGGCTMFFGVPTMYTRLIEERKAYPPTPNTQHPTPSLRLFVSGSAPLAPQTFADFAALFGQPILERYGMTETVMNMTNPYAGERRPGTVGLPFPGQEGRIVDVRSREPLADGAIGEIQVRGPHVFAGYWGRPEATAEAFDGAGWFNTGDLGWRSADGYYTITGRAKELIISGGYNIYPREVEEVLLLHPAVAEAAVFGMPDPDFGEQVAAAVVLSAGAEASAEALIEHCKAQLAAYKKPRQLSFVASLPRNAMGKVQKHLLREALDAVE